ncbi:MAG: hypothetical protein QM650_11885 [Microlunatus sp.]
MKTERLQVLIEVGQRKRLEELAESRGVSVAALVRNAIDLAFPPETSQRAAAAAVILEAEPMAAPEVPDLLAELDDLRGRRG